MQVVHLADAVHGGHHGADLLHFEPGGRGLHQHVDRFLDQPPRPDQDQDADDDAGDRVGAVPAADQHQRARYHHAERSERVRRRVPQHRLEVDVLAVAARQRDRRRDVARQSHEADDQHARAVYV